MNTIVVMAQTLDGKIAKTSDHFVDWTEKADKVFFRESTKKIGVMIMGRKTFETLPGVLPNRLSVVMSRSFPEWEMKTESLVQTSLSPEKILEKLSTQNYKEVAVVGGEQINSLFAEKKLINEIWVTVSPQFFGKGLGLFSDKISLDLQLLHHEKIGENTLLLKYKVLL